MKEMFDADRVRNVLGDTINSVLAEMAFLDCHEAAPGLPVAKPDTEHCVAIDVLKPGSFRIELRVGEQFRKKIISLLFDPAAADSPSQDKAEADLLLEILNVVAGNFISGYFGAQTAAKLELPRYLYYSDPAEGEIVAEIALDAESDPILATLRSIRYRY